MNLLMLIISIFILIIEYWYITFPVIIAILIAWLVSE